MHRRKIQLIAGTTYTISLPKEWVKKNKLTVKDEITLYEKNNRTLVVSPQIIEQRGLKDVVLNVDEYVPNIDQVLFAVYYLGVENITLFAKEGNISKDVKRKIRKTLTHMSGTEISYEDKQKITIKVLIDRSKVDVIQTLYRMSLIIDLSISNMIEDFTLNEIQINENEVDRLYHLITKIVSLSLIDSNVLYSSKIKNASLIPSYLLISKRLENIADNINNLAKYADKHKKDFVKETEILKFLKKELGRSINQIIKIKQEQFEKLDEETAKKIVTDIKNLENKPYITYLKDIVRYIKNIQEEIVNIIFYNGLIKDGVL